MFNAGESNAAVVRERGYTKRRYDERECGAAQAKRVRRGHMPTTIGTRRLRRAAMIRSTCLTHDAGAGDDLTG